MRTYVIATQKPMKNECSAVMASPNGNYHTNFSMHVRRFDLTVSKGKKQ